ncbi:photosynthetic complex putative assembly protein PuhB, partial [Ideonella sp. A 288]|uniref:photosynthetic complex putative assembly protein PuhB n=1 Tax=Ideonella sp. A 288 TaxID=1962181 RepID=UPI000B4AB365
MSRQLATGEHDGEPEPGLPEPLPATERLLWQGSPDWRLLARHGFHLRKFALYFGVLIAWRGLATAVDGGSAGAVLGSMLWPLPLAAAALGFIALLALLVGRNTAYTLTDRRVVMRIGIVLTVTFNLPLSRIETVRLHALGKAQGDAPRAGDIALVLDAQDRIGYLHLWPHARPWHFRRTEPMLRALPQADQVARLLVDALAASVATSAANAAAPSAPARPVPEPS